MDVFVWLKANMPTMPDAVIVFKKQNYCLLRKSSKCRWSCNFRFRNVSKLRLSWTSEEVDEIKEILLNIHSSCGGSDSNGYVDLRKRGKHCWFVKWLTYIACSRSGINLF
jgi:hypothetical protein